MAGSARLRQAVVLVTALLTVAVGVKLGLWQLDRAAQKVDIRQRLDARATQPALQGHDLAGDAAGAVDQHYRRATLRGRWVSEHTVFLENRQVDGRPGFYVVTPLQLEGRPDAVLVQRGWAPRNFQDRSAVPLIPSVPDMVTVQGLIAPPPARLYEFAGAEAGRIRQNIDLASFSRETRLALLPLSVLQADSPDAAGDGLVRKWPAQSLNAQKNYGYAVQWFALAALMAGLYVWFQLVRPLRRVR